MIYLVHGNDGGLVKDKLHGLLKALAIKKPNAEVFRVTLDNWSEGQLNELVESQGLFEHKYIVVLDSIFADKAATEILIDRLADLKKSDNVFIVVEGKIDAAKLTKLSKHAEKVWKADAKETAPKKAFNVFAITDALGRRDRKSLWAMYHSALFNGSEPEELHGLLFWQIKSLLIAAQSKSAEEAGQKPFVWSKAKGFLQNFTPEELKGASSSLVDIYHDARKGIVDFDIALEKFILGV
jgi:DNA polymerase III delta subunit